MAEKGLILNTGWINVGKPAGLNNLASPFSLLILQKPINFDGSDALASKLNAGTSAGWFWGTNAANDRPQFSRFMSGGPVAYDGAADIGRSTSTYYWNAACFDFSLGAAAKVGQFVKTFAAGSFTDLGSTVLLEGSGTVITDAAEDLYIGYNLGYTQQSAMTVMGFGLVSGKKSAAQLQAITADIQGSAWIGLWGKPTVTGVFPKLLGSGSGIADGVSGGASVTLESAGPDWYTSAGGGGGVVGQASNYYSQRQNA